MTIADSSEVLGHCPAVQSGCPILLSIRPSAGHMQGSFPTPSTKLPTVPEPDGVNQQRLYPIHFTDLFEFRQRYSPDDPLFNTDARGWQTSLTCLSDELEYLGVLPKQGDASSSGAYRPNQLIIVGRHIRRCFLRGGWLHNHADLRRRWRGDTDQCRLDRTAAVVEAALEIPDHCIPFWSNNGFRESIELALRTTPPRDVSLYASDSD